MVLLLQGFHKLYFNHHSAGHRRRESDTLLATNLQAFESDVSSCLNQLPSISDSGQDPLSIPWILQLFHVLPAVHRAFAKLVVNLEYPVAKWRGDSADAYFDYSLKLMDLLNSISFSLSQLAQSRLLLSHAASLVENSPSSAIARLRPIVLPKTDFKESGVAEMAKDDQKKISCSGSEMVIRRALSIIEGIGFWICGTVISALNGDSEAYLATRKSAGDLTISAYRRLDSGVCNAVAGRGRVVTEIGELNGAVAQLAAALVAGKNGGVLAEDVRRRLENFEKDLESLGKAVNSQFSEVLTGRNQLLDSYRQ